MQEPILVSGIMVRNLGKDIIVEAEIDGHWVEVIKTYCGPMGIIISHIVEPAGMLAAKKRKEVKDEIRS